MLRSREVYADLRASVPDGPGGPCDACSPPSRARRRDPIDTRPEHASRSAAPARGTRRHAAALPSRRSRRVRRRPDRDDRVRQRRSSFSPASCTDPFDLFFLAGLVLVPLAVGTVGVAIWREAFAALRRRPRAGVALGRRPRPRRRVRARPGSRTRADRHRRRARCSRARQHRRPPLGRGCSLRASCSSSPGSGRARRGGFARSAAAGPLLAQTVGPAHRRHRAHRVHGHLLDRPRDSAQPRGLARSVARRAPAGRRAGLGRSGAGLAVRHGRRVAGDRAQAVLRARARAARRSSRSQRRSPAAARLDAPWAFLDPGGRLRTPPLASARSCRSQSGRWPDSASSCSPRSSVSTCTTA